jgi:NADPH2:quinone reductase
VRALGNGVTGVAVGDRVAWTGIPGAYAEMAVVPTTRLVKLPATLYFRDGAAAMLQGMTAHYLACSTYPLKTGDTCLVHAAAGGVGLLLCQVAKRRGATVIATVSTEAKAALARDAGADHVILYSQEDFVAGVRSATSGQGVHVVYDGVGATTFEKSLDSLRPRGMLVLFGAASGPVPPFDLGQLAAKGSLFVTRPTLFHYILGDAELRARATDVLGWIASGEIKLRIEEDYPLARAADAHRALEGRKTTGKVLLIP